MSHFARLCIPASSSFCICTKMPNACKQHLPTMVGTVSASACLTTEHHVCKNYVGIALNLTFTSAPQQQEAFCL